MPYEPGQPYREEEHSNGHPPSGRDPGHLEEAAFDLFRRVLFPDSHEHHPGEHNTERLADLMRLLDTHGHSSDFRDVLKEVEFYHPGFLNKLKHGDAHDYVEGLYRRHTEEAFDPNEWELDHGGHEKGRVEEEDSHWNREVVKSGRGMEVGGERGGDINR
ncbi:hypothetical protein Pmar_PMAR000186 [Perkinsus marinus ATCC 50983]|uniref:Uncharacterized protein n=1 Tax=Perkinsus marinus (strain ATCC 50983 / TXsc) TaxID=423536 RepID=C5K8P6_PERM5|nr:hypothetical protein Pmar_PMAR000186 [Perkinsus marinus ATCC 50983]EER19123.1 hypothetical protein Pmar_PMAR000186 [Perkinsus marinus ATCC 50983]|eukprot:XP_002787327.1 hypothetical protein Pmar_PMAR000186 [Perkinsus marinus ATCC 50983]